MTSEQVKLSPMEIVTALKEAVKVQTAANYARLAVPTHDEDGEELPQEEMQEHLNELFAEQLEEFEATLAQTTNRLIEAKRAAQESDGPISAPGMGGRRE